MAVLLHSMTSQAVAVDPNGASKCLGFKGWCGKMLRPQMTRILLPRHRPHNLEQMQRFVIVEVGRLALVLSCSLSRFLLFFRFVGLNMYECALNMC